MLLKEISDDLLICLYREKNQDAIDLLLKRYEIFIYGIISDVSKRYPIYIDFEDMFHELLLIFFNCIERYDEDSGCFYFFVRKAMERKMFHVINKITRNNKIISLDTFKYDDGEESKLDYIGESSVSENIFYNEMLERLSEENQKIVRLKMMGYSYGEIAKIVNSTKQSIYRKIRNIKNILKDVIEKID